MVHIHVFQIYTFYQGAANTELSKYFAKNPLNTQKHVCVLFLLRNIEQKLLFSIITVPIPRDLNVYVWVWQFIQTVD